MYVCKCFSKAPHTRSHRAPCSCFPEKVSLHLSSEQSVGDVWIARLDWSGREFLEGSILYYRGRYKITGLEK